MKAKGTVKPDKPQKITVADNARENEAQRRLTGQGNLLVLTGPSGVGKGTVVKGLLEQVPTIVESVSVTTRKSRPGEEDGVHYFFRSQSEFDRMRQADELLEFAEFAGSYYGTPRQWVLEKLSQSTDVLLVIEVQGARQIAQRFPQAVLIFVSPPSLEALEARLVGRATESAEKITLRLRKAKDEMAERHRFHYEVVNDNVEEAVQNLVHIVYAERCRIRNNAHG